MPAAQNDASDTVLLASVLKPLEDVRIYQKIGKSLLRHFPDMRLCVLAYHPIGEDLPVASERVRFVRLFGRGRLHFTRLWANFRLIYQAKNTQAHHLIISTWELIPAALFLSFWRGTRILYDVQENYAANLRHTQVYPWFLRKILAYKISMLEYLLARRGCVFMMAEECYLSEMPWLKPAVLLENKCLREEIKVYRSKTNPKNEPKKWVFTGTVSREYGVFDLIEYCEELRKDGLRFSLNIVGYAAIQAERKQLIRWATERDWLQLKGIAQPVAHAVILEEIQKADIVCMPYRINQSYAGRIPTKFFECIALQKAMLISLNLFWEEYLSKFGEVRAEFVDFRDKKNTAQSQEKITKLYAQKDFKENESENIFWENQEGSLLALFEK